MRPVFGVSRDPGVTGSYRRPQSLTENPMVAALGPGPEGAQCGSCTHLFKRAAAGSYYKCDLRVNTRSARTDHRVRWPACAEFTDADRI